MGGVGCACSFFKTSLCIRCPVSFLPSIAMYMCLLYYNVPEPDGGREVVLSSQPNKPRRCSSWREGLGIEQTVQHYGEGAHTITSSCKKPLCMAAPEALEAEWSRMGGVLSVCLQCC